MDQIKVSKVQYADSWGRTKWGEKNPRGREKKRKKARAERLGPGLKHHLGAEIYDAELDARVTGAELPTMSLPCGSRAQEHDARDADAETC